MHNKLIESSEKTRSQHTESRQITQIHSQSDLFIIHKVKEKNVHQTCFFYLNIILNYFQRYHNVAGER